MGKSEILMLLAGVALSVMLAMIAVPMFSSGNEMADRQQVQQDLMSIKSSIPLILALEGNDKGKFNSKNLEKHVTGFSSTVDPTGDPLGSTLGGTIVNTKNKDDANKKTTYAITDDQTNDKVTILVTAPTKFDLRKLSRIESICDAKASNPLPTTDATKHTFTCEMNR